MPSASQTAINPEGYLIQIPTLGLPTHNRERQCIRVVIGTKNEAIALLESCIKKQDAPLLVARAECTYFTVEHKGAVWRFPTALRAHYTPPAQLFSIEAERVQLAKAPAIERPKLPDDIDWLFVDKQTQELEYGHLDCTEQELRELHQSLGGRFSMASLRIFSNCISPTPSQAEPILPRAHSFDDVEARRREAQNEAGMVWRMMSSSYLNQDWLKKLHDEAIAAGLRKQTDVFDPSKPIAMFRVHPEDNFDNVRSLDYALCNMDGTYPPPHQATWLPFPPDASDPVWVRCGINLFRFNLGRRLFSKEEWPPRATS